MLNEAVYLPAPFDPNTQWSLETDIPSDAVVSAHTLALQDPTPGYALYLPQRFVPVANTANSNDHIIANSATDLQTIFPTAPNPSSCFGHYSITWTPAP
jgi:hypothetical protein